MSKFIEVELYFTQYKIILNVDLIEYVREYDASRTKIALKKMFELGEHRDGENLLIVKGTYEDLKKLLLDT
jgi:hypothetical protein